MARPYGKGRVFQRGRKWWVAYYAPVQGRSIEVRESAGESEVDARQMLDQRRLEVLAHRRGVARFEANRERVSLTQLVDEVLADLELRRPNEPSERYRLQHIDDVFGATPAARVSSEAVAAYIMFRREQGASDATIDHETGLIRRAFKRPNAPFPPRIPRLVSLHTNARTGFLSQKQFDAILAALPKDESDFRDLLTWFWWTGMRPKEIGTLTWSDLDEQTGSLRLAARNAKTKRARVVPIVGPLAAIIARRKKARSGLYIFHFRGKCSVRLEKNGRGFTSVLTNRWNAAAKKAGVPGSIPYDLRRCAIRNLRAAGVPERVAMEISGHRSRATFDRYGIVDETDLKTAFAKVAQLSKADKNTDRAARIR